MSQSRSPSPSFNPDAVLSSLFSSSGGEAIHSLVVSADSDSEPEIQVLPPQRPSTKDEFLCLGEIEGWRDFLRVLHTEEVVLLESLQKSTLPQETWEKVLADPNGSQSEQLCQVELGDGASLDSGFGSIGSASPGSKVLAAGEGLKEQDGENDNSEIMNGPILRLDAGPGCGGLLWPPSLVLARYLSLPHIQDSHFGISNPGLSGSEIESRRRAHRHVLELGSGTGAVGICLASVLARNGWNGKVTVTDMTEIIPILSSNVGLNRERNYFRSCTNDGKTPTKVEVETGELMWGDPLPPLNPRPTLILLADCIYEEKTFPLLVRTLVDLTEPQKSINRVAVGSDSLPSEDFHVDDIPAQDDVEILLCYKKRRKAVKRFFSLLRKSFTYTEVSDDPHQQSYSREAIYLYRVHRKSSRKNWKA